MNAHTHVLGGLAVAGLAISVGVPHPVTLAVASGFGGLVPDWDHPHSTIGRWIPWPAVSHSRGPYLPPAVGRVGFLHPIWHRHQAHSIVGTAAADVVFALLAFVVWMVLRGAGHGFLARFTFPIPWVLLGLFLGGLSHLALDGFNETEQWWLWPFSKKGFRWPIHAPVKRIDAPVSLALTVVVLLLAWHVGHMPMLRLMRTAGPSAASG
ncbi:MAG: metal-dependent hydrolase [Firmicutes bacterium]|nr:metal-dependent hydrolase [Bacillota bacterium]